MTEQAVTTQTARRWYARPDFLRRGRRPRPSFLRRHARLYEELAYRRRHGRGLPGKWRRMRNHSPGGQCAQRQGPAAHRADTRVRVRGRRARLSTDPGERPRIPLQPIVREVRMGVVVNPAGDVHATVCCSPPSKATYPPGACPESGTRRKAAGTRLMPVTHTGLDYSCRQRYRRPRDDRCRHPRRIFSDDTCKHHGA
jgi:hypothetical protein